MLSFRNFCACITHTYICNNSCTTCIMMTHQRLRWCQPGRIVFFHIQISQSLLLNYYCFKNFPHSVRRTTRKILHYLKGRRADETLSFKSNILVVTGPNAVTITIVIHGGQWFSGACPIAMSINLINNKWSLSRCRPLWRSTPAQCHANCFITVGNDGED